MCSNRKLVYVGSLDIEGNDSIRRVYSSEGISPTLTSMQGGNRQPKILDLRDTNWKEIQVKDICPTQRASNYNLAVIDENYLIRKLTPKECWRLMGRDDEDIDRCITAGVSNTQLYKQAGNSIVVDVLVKIFEMLILHKNNKMQKETQISFL